MNLWINNAEIVEVLAPLIKNQTPHKSLRYIHPDLKFNALPVLSLLSFLSALQTLIFLPVVFFKILSAMSRADHLHIRCPGNIGLIACIAQIFFPQKNKTAKYAGNWDRNSKQPWSYNLQKWILKNEHLSKNMNVLVYGKWENESRNIQSFYTASFSEKEKTQIEKEFTAPYRFIYVGNLVKGKGVLKAIDFVVKLKKLGYNCTLKIYGGGILEESVKEYILKNNLSETVVVMGRKTLDELQEAYKKAHFIILLSKSEGWPKALAEGMWYGAISISTRVSCVPWMLGDGERGLLVDNEESNTDLGIKKMKYLLDRPEILEEMSRQSILWAQEFSLEGFDQDIKSFL
ncbi:glycosyltransferase [Christiangramia sp. SM2212]|uniref:Glycosyltransferase n=1 Tax=Christiangramia sediminicola TaxID=3073267 RepID=A0ABU1EP17_9FLAO|nr:glycosyltransferase [Christiangramia sp. SM2212]MDR5589719.1 glycosyltransferase [Christiangramia sp. SM2212]